MHLDIAQCDSLAPRGERIARWHELVRYIALESRISDSFTNSCPVQFLACIKLMAARHATRVIKGYVFVILADGAYNVAFHDLHMIDVIKQSYARGSNSFDYLQSERGVIALIVFVIYFAV